MNYYFTYSFLRFENLGVRMKNGIDTQRNMPATAKIANGFVNYIATAPAIKVPVAVPMPPPMFMTPANRPRDSFGNKSSVQESVAMPSATVNGSIV